MHTASGPFALFTVNSSVCVDRRLLLKSVAWFRKIAFVLNKKHPKGFDLLQQGQGLTAFFLFAPSPSAIISVAHMAYVLKDVGGRRGGWWLLIRHMICTSLGRPLFCSVF